jgi:hypothetical protein
MNNTGVLYKNSEGAIFTRWPGINCYQAGHVPKELIDILTEAVGENKAEDIAVLIASRNLSIMIHKEEPPLHLDKPWWEPPKRTVKERLVRKHSWTKSHYADGVCFEIMKRYVRMYKITCIDYKEFLKIRDAIHKKLYPRYEQFGFTSYDFGWRYKEYDRFYVGRSHVYSGEREEFPHGVFIQGRHYEVQNKQDLDILSKILTVLRAIEKYDKEQNAQPVAGPVEPLPVVTPP